MIAVGPRRARMVITRPVGESTNGHVDAFWTPRLNGENLRASALSEIGREKAEPGRQAGTRVYEPGLASIHRIPEAIVSSGVDSADRALLRRDRHVPDKS